MRYPTLRHSGTAGAGITIAIGVEVDVRILIYRMPESAFVLAVLSGSSKSASM
jgi:hypothetical protein